MARKNLPLLKAAVWLACLVPLGSLLLDGVRGTLGANPVETISLTTGMTTLVLLMVTLAVTPLRKLTGWNWLIRFRRLFGLFAFFYVCLHFSTYIVLDKYFDLPEMAKDITKRRYITMGVLAFMSLIPLAATSTAWSIRKLGGRRWSLLHRLIYLSAIAGVIHFWWKEKADIEEPAIFAAALTVLLAFRIGFALHSKRRERWNKPAPASQEVRG